MSIPITENNIIKEFNKGSDKAFKWLYDEYFVLLRYYGLRYLKDIDEIDDIIQELYVHIWEMRGQFSSLPKIRAYLFQSVRNRCLNKIRHNQVIAKSEEYLKGQESEDSVLENLIKLEVFDELMTAFNKLPEGARQVYWMSLNGLSHKEISEKLKISVNTIKTHKMRANAFLKKELKGLFSILMVIALRQAQ